MQLQEIFTSTCMQLIWQETMFLKNSAQQPWQHKQHLIQCFKTFTGFNVCLYTNCLLVLPSRSGNRLQL